MATKQQTVGRKISELRGGLALSQAAFAAACEVAPTTIWRIENDRVRPSYPVLLRIAEVGGVPVSALVPDDQSYFE